MRRLRKTSKVDRVIYAISALFFCGLIVYQWTPYVCVIAARALTEARIDSVQRLPRQARVEYSYSVGGTQFHSVEPLSSDTGFTGGESVGIDYSAWQPQFSFIDPGRYCRRSIGLTLLGSLFVIFFFLSWWKTKPRNGEPATSPEAP